VGKSWKRLVKQSVAHEHCRAVVVDFTLVTRIDYTGVQALKEAVEDCRAGGAHVSPFALLVIAVCPSRLDAMCPCVSLRSALIEVCPSLLDVSSDVSNIIIRPPNMRTIRGHIDLISVSSCLVSAALLTTNASPACR